MRNFERKQKLAEEALKLIMEFREESKIFGETSFKSIKISEDYNSIIVEDFCDGKFRFDLREVTNIFKDDIEKKGPYGIHFYNALDEIREEATNRFDKLDKQAFMECIGSTYYVQRRCEDIYDRLKNIENEFSEL
ncbi:hypothetical protein [Clostridium sp. B9]|uniref:hypothetical protein n=1 Tax=Clostridium sp. B9 TaxID=3423224 RepID=UPI003D2EF2A7